jgi:hypothetical protein
MMMMMMMMMMMKIEVVIKRSWNKQNLVYNFDKKLITQKTDI